ncbi:Dyp-type peroxidase, partial [Burkholderia ubonensis]|uniref:Dyp-type peroxidase n=1 Tax=Burkholderia ubonensis TaxID=101571 RepID=UPI000A889CF8
RSPSASPEIMNKGITSSSCLTYATTPIIGRTKLSDIELDAEVKPSSSHSSLTTLVENGEEVKILRDNMPFGRPGAGEFGTYFIGYARSPAPIEQMLENMFVGRPPGNYDRLLDYSRAVTGSLFFVPSADLLDALATRAAPAADAVPPAASPSTEPASNGSLKIGSLKGTHPHE